MSTIEVQKPPPPFLLDSFPPETRVVVADVTWDDYEGLVERSASAGTTASPLMVRTSR